MKYFLGEVVWKWALPVGLPVVCRGGSGSFCRIDVGWPGEVCMVGN